MPIGMYVFDFLLVANQVMSLKAPKSSDYS
jgi:hypothetical protein